MKISCSQTFIVSKNVALYLKFVLPLLVLLAWSTAGPTNGQHCRLQRCRGHCHMQSSKLHCERLQMITVIFFTFSKFHCIIINIIIADDITSGKPKQFLKAVNSYQHPTLYLQHHGAVYHLSHQNFSSKLLYIIAFEFINTSQIYRMVQLAGRNATFMFLRMQCFFSGQDTEQ